MAGDSLEDYDIKGHTENVCALFIRGRWFVCLRLWFTEISTGRQLTDDTFSIMPVPTQKELDA